MRQRGRFTKVINLSASWHLFLEVHSSICARSEIIVTGNWVSYGVQVCVKMVVAMTSGIFQRADRVQEGKVVQDKSLTKNKRLKTIQPAQKGTQSAIQENDGLRLD